MAKPTKISAPKRKLVSWNLSQAQIDKRRRFCADPDVHGVTCVCLASRKRGRSDRITDVNDALYRAQVAVYKLAREVDPGHGPMIKYLEELESRLRTEAYLLGVRIEEESGG